MDDRPGGIRGLGRALASTARARAERRGAEPRRTSDAQVGRLRVSWTLLVVASLVVVGAFTLAPSIGLLLEQRQTIADLQQQVADQQESVDDLGDQVAQWDDPAYIEAQARDRLFYVYPGETAYVVIDDRGPAESVEQAPAFTTDLVESQGDWVQAGIASVVLAGLTDADADDLSSGAPLDAR
ncbi:FtsB family cell division protein [Agrococcus jejuensis]|uniref:FtsB family cell division protein n=1 Tax=Agrococcus jejuensis TaxID=399736 RepID=UPI00119E3D4D|nr:septum formation initiator family protein [Agrococcus jejuensis]